jgi:hypothetical protein
MHMRGVHMMICVAMRTSALSVRMGRLIHFVLTRLSFYAKESKLRI